MRSAIASSPLRSGSSRSSTTTSGALARGQRDRAGRVAGGCRRRDAAGILQARYDPVAHDRMVVDDGDANHGRPPARGPERSFRARPARARSTAIRPPARALLHADDAVALRAGAAPGRSRFRRRRSPGRPGHLRGSSAIRRACAWRGARRWSALRPRRDTVRLRPHASGGTGPSVKRVATIPVREVKRRASAASAAGSGLPSSGSERRFKTDSRARRSESRVTPSARSTRSCGSPSAGKPPQRPLELERDRGQVLRQRVVDLARHAGAFVGAGERRRFVGERGHVRPRGPLGDRRSTARRARRRRAGCQLRVVRFMIPSCRPPKRSATLAW